MAAGRVRDSASVDDPMSGAALNRRAVLLGLVLAPVATRAQVRRGGPLVAAARRQVGVTLAYDPAYTSLRFPGGDVPRAKGVCTDVVVRAYRDALGLDLQALVNADMRRAFAAYPTRWGLRRTDASIDHRRVPNLQVFLARQGARLPLPRDARGWQAGDLFTALIGDRLPHIGIVSDRGPGWVIHNIGNGAREEPALYAHQLTGRYRWQV